MNAFDGPKRQFRHAARSLLRRPVLSLVALATLGLGIGANTAIFSIINVVLLKPLPFHDPDRLSMVWSTAPGQGLTEGFSSYPDFKDWHDQSKAFVGLAAFWTFPNGDVNLTGGSEPQRVSVARVTPGFFEVLGVPPLHGRTFREEELARHDPDDGVRHLVHQHRAPNQARIAAKLIVPQSVAQWRTVRAKLRVALAGQPWRGFQWGADAPTRASDGSNGRVSKPANA